MKWWAFVAVAANDSFLHARRRDGRQTLALTRGFARDDQETCHCNCCTVAKRLPAETIGPTDVKCVEDLGKFGCENEVCQLPTVPRVITNTDVTLTSQFCFLECKPIDDVVATQCMELTQEEVDRAKTDDGNGEDVNPLPHKYAPVQETPAPLVKSAPQDSESAGGKPVDVEDKKDSVNERLEDQTKVIVTDEAIFEALIGKIRAEAQDHARTAEQHIRAAWDSANEAKEVAKEAREMRFG